MSTRYAAKTEVSVEKTRAEIETLLARYGADAFGYQVADGVAKLAFRMNGRYFRFSLTLPDPQDKAFTTYMRGGTRYRRTDSAAHEQWAQATRSRWRALLLVIKAKLEAIEVGISTLDDEFMAAMVLPNGQTMAEEYGPQIRQAYELGKMPARLMLEGPGA